VVPDIKLSTAEAYKRIEMSRRRANPARISTLSGGAGNQNPPCRGLSFADTKMLTKNGYNVNILIHALRRHRLSLLSTCLFNDFSEPLFRTYPGLFKIKHRLKELGVKGISFSGKGPSLFGLVKSRKEARQIRDRLTKERHRVFAVGTFKGTVFSTG
jgi:hypothetical protein